MSWDIPSNISKEKQVALSRIKSKAFNCYRTEPRRYVGFYKAFDRIKNDPYWTALESKS